MAIILVCSNWLGLVRGLVRAIVLYFGADLDKSQTLALFSHCFVILWGWLEFIFPGNPVIKVAEGKLSFVHC